MQREAISIFKQIYRFALLELGICNPPLGLLNNTYGHIIWGEHLVSIWTQI